MMGCAHFLTPAILACWAGVAIAGDPGRTPSASTGREQSNTVQHIPQMVRCGPNALYMFLKLHDLPISADVFFCEVAPGDHGLSLAELRDASIRYGLPAEVRRCTYEQLLAGSQLTLIALLHPNIGISRRSAGHYVLVVAADSKEVSLIDGTSGEQKRYGRDAFCRNWEGYVVVPSKKHFDWWLLLGISAAAWLFVGWHILRGINFGKRGVSVSRIEDSTHGNSR